MIFTTQQLYLRSDLSELKGLTHPHDLYKRLEWLEEALTKENEKDMLVRNNHLITKINTSKKFWLERIGEVEL